MSRVLVAGFIDDAGDELVDVHLTDLEDGSTAFHAIQLEHIVERVVEPFGIPIDVAGERPHLG